MVASNDNDERKRALPAGGKSNVYVTGTPHHPLTYTYTLTGKRRGQSVPTLTKVTDDLGAHIEVRRGECVILDRLIDEEIAKLRIRKANDD